MNKKISFLLSLGLCLLVASCGPALVVNSSGDLPDVNPGDGTCKTANNDCTLRAALMEADADANVSNITFDTSMTISPITNLPPLTSNNTKIRGEGKSIILDGSQNPDPGSYGLHILNSSRNVIQGLQIQYFFLGIKIESNGGTADENIIGLLPTETGDLTQANALIHNDSGVLITGANAYENNIAGNFIGVAKDGSTVSPNEFSGVSLDHGAHNNLIGSLSGTSLQEGGNLISGNDGPGIWISHGVENHVSGNYIGTNVTGLSRVENYTGIRITNGSTNNTIGLHINGDGQPNLISGNEYFGIVLTDAANTKILGNLIGTNVHGTQPLHNLHGIWLEEGSMQTTIGTNGDGINDQAEGNLISGNSQHGIYIGQNCVTNFISGNLIGTTADGLSALGNGWGGISLHGDDNRIGTDGDQTSDDLEGNTICGSGTTGITVTSNFNQIAGNKIGVGVDGTTPLGNTLFGVIVFGNDNLIGTDGDGKSDQTEGNLVSANGTQGSGSGIVISGNDNIVAGNQVGTDSSGTAALGNNPAGIALNNGATGNIIGTNGDGVSDDLEGNLVSGNSEMGITIAYATSNTVAGNLVGTDISGLGALPNGLDMAGNYGAIHLGPGASLNVIGTNGNGQNDDVEGNLISGNPLYGVMLSGPSCQNNAITGNIIGLDISGSAALGNLGGIVINSGCENILVGTNADGLGDAYEGNLIGGNQNSGMLIAGSNIQVSGNAIGTDKFGNADLGNGGQGIEVVEPASDIEIGGSSQKANIIAFNKLSGVSIVGANADKIRMINNSIHSNEKLGINLESSSGLYDVLINDPGDIDTGPNDLMNYPDLNSATSITGFIGVQGEIINGLPHTSFLVQFFSNDTCDSPSNHGEGKQYIGSSQVYTDGNGNASFSSSFGGSVSAGKQITSTATAFGQTSEFSNCVEVIEGTETYMEKADSEEDYPCDLLLEAEYELITFPARIDTGQFTLYVESSFPFPIASDDPDSEYTAVLGNVQAAKCDGQGFDNRRYCVFYLPETYFNTLQPLKVYNGLCVPPFLTIDEVSIFITVPEGPRPESTPTGCHSDLNERDCIAAGGTYSAATNKCICPRN